jgi:glucokinase
MSSRRALGIDLGGTHIKVVLLQNGRVVEKRSRLTSAEEGVESVLDRLVELGRAFGEFASVGVAVPGLVDQDGVGLLFPNLPPEWSGVSIRRLLEQRFDQPVALLNDGHAFTLAEARMGAARGATNAVGVVCGTGVGGGLVLGGRLWEGIDGRAGEIGHQTVVADGTLCGCGNRGCLETLASGPAIARSAGTATFDHALAAARRGDSMALEAIASAGRYLGIAIANAVLLLTPSRVIVGGGVAEAGDLLLDPLGEELKRRAGAVGPLDRIRVVRAELGPLAGGVGAALHGADRAIDAVVPG